MFATLKKRRGWSGVTRSSFLLVSFFFFSCLGSCCSSRLTLLSDAWQKMKRRAPTKKSTKGARTHPPTQRPSSLLLVVCSGETARMVLVCWSQREDDQRECGGVAMKKLKKRDGYKGVEAKRRVHSLAFWSKAALSLRYMVAASGQRQSCGLRSQRRK